MMRIAEYLATSYRPDCDFVDGEVHERTLGEFSHSNMQRALIGYLGPREREWKIRVMPGLRFRTSATASASLTYASCPVTNH